MSKFLLPSVALLAPAFGAPLQPAELHQHPIVSEQEIQYIQGDNFWIDKSNSSNHKCYRTYGRDDGEYRVPVTYRDFKQSDLVGGMPDFQMEERWQLATGVRTGMVQSTLSTDSRVGRPVPQCVPQEATRRQNFKGFNTRPLANCDNFHFWYKCEDTAGCTYHDGKKNSGAPTSIDSIKVESTLLFKPNNDGKLQMQNVPGEYNTKMFFPLNGEGFNDRLKNTYKFWEACPNEPHANQDDGCDFPSNMKEGWGSWVNNTKGDVHWTNNFLFTSEIQLEFFYYGQMGGRPPATFKFEGDDDVWVFMNNKLAIDLGGVHKEEARQIVLNQAKGKELGMQEGSSYTMHVFHAERQYRASNFYMEFTLAVPVDCPSPPLSPPLPPPPLPPPPSTPPLPPPLPPPMCTIKCDTRQDKSDILAEFLFHDWTAEHPDFQRRDLSAQGNWGGNSGEKDLWDSNGIIFNNKIKKWHPPPQTTGVVKGMVTPQSNNLTALHVQPVGAHAADEQAACTSTGVTGKALSFDPNPGTAQKPRPCAKDFDTWYKGDEPGQCPVQRHLPFRHKAGTNLWRYASSTQGVPAYLRGTVPPSMPSRWYRGFFPLDSLGWDDRLPCRGSKEWNDEASPLVWTDLGSTKPAVPEDAVELTDAYNSKVTDLKKAFREGKTTFTQKEWDDGFGFVVLRQNYVQSQGHYYRAEKQKLGGDKTKEDHCTAWLPENYATPGLANTEKHYWHWGAQPDLDHNFLFSTQITRRFRYIASKMRKDFFSFQGDDDVWGYLQSDQDARYKTAQLVVDIGGIHNSSKDAFWLGTNADRFAGSVFPALSLQDGAYYTLSVFHAERQLFQSNFEMWMPVVECLCTPDEGAPFGVSDDRFPRECRENPFKPECDGLSFPMVESTAMVTAASATDNGITTGKMAHALCKTCKSECYGTAWGQDCHICPECKGQGTAAYAKCPTTA